MHPLNINEVFVTVVGIPVGTVVKVAPPSNWRAREVNVGVDPLPIPQVELLPVARIVKLSRSELGIVKEVIEPVPATLDICKVVVPLASMVNEKPDIDTPFVTTGIPDGGVLVVVQVLVPPVNTNTPVCAPPVVTNVNVKVSDILYYSIRKNFFKL